MHRNTYLLVTFLAILAALVVGVNIGKKLAGPSSVTKPSTPLNTPAPTITAQVSTQIYTNAFCNTTLQYPQTFTKLTDASGSAVLVDSADTKQSILITCQKNIPPPPLPSNQIETINILSTSSNSGVSAMLYHDKSAKDGTLVDELIIPIPKTSLDFYIAGYGDTFNQVIRSITLH